MTGVAIAGVGVTEPAPGERLSHAELLYRATRAALDDAGLERDAITAAVTATYDYVEGRPLSNQFTLDSIGGVMKPCDLRVGDDGMHALAAGVVSALADPGGVVVVASVLMSRTEHLDETVRGIEEISYEPIYLRPVLADAGHPEAIGFGLRARQYLHAHGGEEDDLARLVSRRSAANGSARERSVDEILDSPQVAGPLHEGHQAPPTDLAATFVLSTEPPSGMMRARIRGVGWAAVDGMLGYRSLGDDEATARAAARAYRAAGVSDPGSEIDRAEVYNLYGIDEVLACEALGLAGTGGGLERLLDDSAPRVNPTGGVQAQGFARATSSLAQAGRALQEMAGGSDRVLVAQGWTGCVACSSAVAVMEVAA